eukprot:7601285-Ditylum_brightwellii.AAC.1
MKRDAENKDKEQMFEMVSLQEMISDLEETIQQMESKSIEMESKISGLRQQVQGEIENKRAELQALEAQLTEKFNCVIFNVIHLNTNLFLQLECVRVLTTF